MKKTILLCLVLICFLNISVLASKLSYTVIYVGRNKAYVNDIEKQIDADNPDVAVFVENDRSYVTKFSCSSNISLHE